jgi:Flp pilus assembly pilin Flp
MTATLVRFARDDSGATAVEYGLIAVTNSFLNIGNKL